MKIFELINKDMNFFKIYYSAKQDKFYFKAIRSKYVNAHNIHLFKRELELCEVMINK